VLDRNGLRPSRYYVTKDGLVVMASEAGVLDIDPPRTSWPRRAACSPGRMFLVDTAQGRIIDDEEIKDEMAARAPYRRVAQEAPGDLDDLPRRPCRGRAGPRRPAAAPAGLRLHLRGPAHR
jgi:glutamate synthase (NADPH/NADH) large chain